MKRLSVMLAGVCAVALIALAASEAPAQKKKLKPSKEWKGSVADEKLMQGAPQVIVGPKTLEKVWKEWKVAGKVPEIDFTKEILVVSTTRGSRLSLQPVLDDKGNLVTFGLSTRDLAPGFRYVIGAVSRDGIKTVNGKELPRD